MADQDQIIPARLVWQRYGVCDRTLDRWLADPQLGFPDPVRLRGRRYFSLNALGEWERDQAAKSRKG